MITFDPEALARRVTELEAQMSEPGFWDDQQRAAAISAEHSRLSARLDRYQGLLREYEDARELHSLDGDMADEIAATLVPLRRELDRLQEAALFSGEYDAGDAVVTIQADAGGTDAQDFAELLLRMYLRWAEARGYRTEVIEASPGEEAGLKSATFTVHGENAYGVLKAERGVHRLVRLSPFDQAHRRHTSFAQVIVSPLVPDDVDIDIDEKDLRVDTYRSSGAGGQHVNVTDSAVRITHLPTGIVVSCQNEKSQIQNRIRATAVLRARLQALAEEKAQQEASEQRRSQVRTVDRSERVRTYNFPQDRVTDHRIGLTVHNLPERLDGEIDDLIDALIADERGRLLAGTAA